ncbi:MAG: acylphosphatase, partial [Thermoprotei archaeon]|nr:acylphosphatase [Thermoprotei archaeon]
RALKLNLKGYVANEPDGTVTIVAEGPREAIEKLLEECKRGPPLAVVERVEIEWVQPTGSYETFEVIYRDYELP